MIGRWRLCLEFGMNSALFFAATMMIVIEMRIG